jgi:SAM-dependent methyltransferase
LAFFDKWKRSGKLICGDYFQNVEPGTVMSAEQYYLERKKNGAYGIKKGIDEAWHKLAQERFNPKHTAWKDDPSAPYNAEKSLAKISFLSVNSQEIEASTAPLRGQLDLVIMNKGLCHCSPKLSAREAPLTCAGICAFTRQSEERFFAKVIDLLAPDGVAFFHQEHQLLPPKVLQAAKRAAAAAPGVHHHYLELGEWSAVFLVKSSSDSCSAG